MEKIIAEKEDIKLYPYHGICGKCGNYAEKINKDFLCKNCVFFGIRLLSYTKEGISQVMKFLKPRF